MTPEARDYYDLGLLCAQLRAARNELRSFGPDLSDLFNRLAHYDDAGGHIDFARALLDDAVDAVNAVLEACRDAQLDLP